MTVDTPATTRARVLGICIAALIAAAGLAACAGLDLGDYIRVQTPHAVQQASGIPATMTLNQAEGEYRAWHASISDAGARWKAAIERGHETRALVSQLTLQTLSDVGPTVAGLPVLGPALPLLTLLGGWFLRRPGDVSRADMAREKEASYNAGMRRSRDAVLDEIRRLGVALPAAMLSAHTTTLPPPLGGVGSFSGPAAPERVTPAQNSTDMPDG
ncbi:MAG: hypothetical protein KF847_19635 [Pirellulales bacterium]|nr:hypothetical protein [Pirellulales bacterium]